MTVLTILGCASVLAFPIWVAVAHALKGVRP